MLLQAEITELKRLNESLTENNEQLCAEIQTHMLDVQRSKKEVSDAQLTATSHQQRAEYAK
jgi:hypothetical protein